MHRRFPACFLLTLILFALTACVTGTGTGVISGTLFFSDAEPPPADRVVTVEIYSFDNVEAPAEFISRAYVPSTGSSALPFAVAYDKSRIVPKEIYIVQAYVEDSGGKVSWKSALWNTIITQGRPTRDIQLQLRPN